MWWCVSQPDDIEKHVRFNFLWNDHAVAAALGNCISNGPCCQLMLRAIGVLLAADAWPVVGDQRHFELPATANAR